MKNRILTLLLSLSLLLLPACGNGSSSSSAADADVNVDLSAFYTDTMEKYEFPNSLELAEGELLDGYFAGLSEVETEQCLVYLNMMSINNGEIALVQVKNSADVDTVKGILQDHIDYMAEGGAFYPEATELWSNSSKVVSNGSYIMMVVNPSCDAIVEDFNALF
ncbi:MAG: DUF4358 domain-containing protein [Lawsonibacter sp.]|nr:DUF4358 domain-containing protein [Lawsonibacter sp.]